MITYLSTSFVNNFKRRKHSFKKLAEHYEFADFIELVELEKETKWWEIVKNHVDFIFNRIHKFHSHRFDKRFLKEWAQIMYSNLFFLKWSPSTDLIKNLLSEDPSDIPLCPLVEVPPRVLPYPLPILLRDFIEPFAGVKLLKFISYANIIKLIMLFNIFNINKMSTF